jgi:hypothetical protein
MNQNSSALPIAAARKRVISDLGAVAAKCGDDNEIMIH